MERDNQPINTSMQTGEKGRYNFPVQNLVIPAYICDLRGRIIEYNKHALELWGRAPVEDDLWCVSWKPIDEDDNVVSKIGYAASSSPNRAAPVMGNKIIIERSNGSYSIIVPHSSPTTDDAGMVNGLFTIMIDVTDRKLAAAKLASINESLELKVKERTVELMEANGELEKFSYTVSHDLKAPLRSISGFSKLLLANHKGKLDEEGLGYLQIINRNAIRMSSLVRDLLEFSRTGRVSLEYSEVNLGAQVKQVVEELMSDDISFGPDIILHELKPAVCDGRLIKQVWANLIGNALKYSSKKDKPVIEIGMARQQGQPVYYVKDNGTGFDMQQADKLFGVFQRLHGSEDFEGSGVGLATVHRIITKHGGRIWAESKTDEGATFYFTIS